MPEVYVSFVREERNGIVAVGSYLADVFSRFGVRFEMECDGTNRMHVCEITIIEGVELLSGFTGVELEHFAGNGRRTNRRLTCEARIIKPGEVAIMTDERKETPKNHEPKKDKFQEEFEALPLEKKIASLLRMEAVTLGETFAYVVNSPMKVVEKVGDVIAEFGMKLEKEARKAARPSETNSEAAGSKQSTGKSKASTSKKTSAPRPPKA